MSVYYLLLFITFILQFTSAKTDQQYLKRTIISFIPFFIYAATRLNFGPDYSAYESFFETIKEIPFKDYDPETLHMERGFAYLCKIIPSWRLFLVLDSFLVAATYVSLIYKYVPRNYSWLAVLLIFLTGNNTIFFDLVAMRNGIVVSILILSLPLIKNRKLLPFAAITGLAYTIHASAIFFFPLAYLLGVNKSLTKKELYIWTGVLLAFTVLSANNIIDRITFVVMLIGDRYESTLQEVAENYNRGFLATIFSLLLSGLLLIGQYKGEKNLNDNEKVILRLSLLFSFSYLLGSLNTRVSQYFVLMFIAAIPILTNISKNGYKYFLIGLVLVYCFYSFYIVWILNNPYFVYQQYHSTLFD